MAMGERLAGKFESTDRDPRANGLECSIPSPD